MLFRSNAARHRFAFAAVFFPFDEHGKRTRGVTRGIRGTGAGFAGRPMRRHRLTPGDSLETAGRLNGVYVAKHHEVPADRLAQLLARVHAGNLITVHESGLQATFVPFHLEQRRSGQVLVTHLVRNNPQAVEPIVGDALVILDVDDAYISPSWYATNESLPNVPTWDYITIHIGGPVRVLTSPDESLAAARALTLRMEQPAVLEAVGEQKLHKMARAIVGVEVLVRRVEAKAKAGQHRHPDDLRSVDTAAVSCLLRFYHRFSVDHVAWSCILLKRPAP